MFSLLIFHSIVIYSINEYVRLHSVREQLSTNVNVAAAAVSCLLQLFESIFCRRHRHHHQCSWCCIFHLILVYYTAGLTLYSFAHVHIHTHTHIFNSTYMDASIWYFYFFVSSYHFCSIFFNFAFIMEKNIQSPPLLPLSSVSCIHFSTCWYYTNTYTHSLTH